MSYLGSWKIDDLLTFPANTHLASSGAATDADAVPAYRVYEDETGTAILTGSMAKLDDANTTGFYSEQLTLSAANGFEKGKCYTVYISAAVSSVTGTMSHTFQIEAEVDANVISDTGTALTAIPWNAAWDTEVQSEVADALDAAIPGTPTADSINQRIRSMDLLTEASGTGDLAAILADTNELQGDWVDTGRLDTILDAILVDTAALPDSVTGGAYALDTDANGRIRIVDGTAAGELQTASGVVDANVAQISTSATAADNLEASALGIVLSTVNDASAQVNTFVTALTEDTDDFYNGRIIIFYDSADTLLFGQATDITDYNGTTKAVTVTPLTNAPGNGYKFVII